MKPKSCKIILVNCKLHSIAQQQWHGSRLLESRFSAQLQQGLEDLTKPQITVRTLIDFERDPRNRKRHLNSSLSLNLTLVLFRKDGGVCGRHLSPPLHPHRHPASQRLQLGISERQGEKTRLKDGGKSLVCLNSFSLSHCSPSPTHRLLHRPRLVSKWEGLQFVTGDNS